MAEMVYYLVLAFPDGIFSVYYQYQQKNRDFLKKMNYYLVQ